MNVSRDEFLLQLRAMNIGASIHYAPLHNMPLYESVAPLTQTEHLAKAILTLPISTSMSLDDAYRVTEVFQQLFYRALD